MPNIWPVHKDEWNAHNMDRLTALVYKESEEDGDYYLNMDNDYLLSELKGKKGISQDDLTKARYKYSMALIGMSIIAPVLIPMLEAMADLDTDDLALAV